MASMLNQAYDIIWSEKFWFNNSSWDYLDTATGDVYYPRIRDLWVSFVCAILVFAVRHFIESHFWRRFGIYFGLRNVTVKHAEQNPKLERIFRREKRPKHDRIKEISSAVDWNIRKVERWFRYRRNQDKSSLLKKFCESGWRFIYYTTILPYGLILLWNKEWAWDFSKRELGHPYIPVERDEYWYYMIGLGYYYSAIIHAFTDVKRKDFLEMMVHHMATILLMVFSWTSNMVRVGCLVICLHDCVDALMEAAKMCKYIKYDKACNAFFISFTITWFITRLYLYPCVIIHSCLHQIPGAIGFFYATYLMNFFLIVLQVLHVIWFWMIIKIAYQALDSGNLTNDSRSDSELSELTDTDTTKTDDTNHNHRNHNGSVVK